MVLITHLAHGRERHSLVKPVFFDHASKLFDNVKEESCYLVKCQKKEICFLCFLGLFLGDTRIFCRVIGMFSRVRPLNIISVSIKHVFQKGEGRSEMHVVLVKGRKEKQSRLFKV